MKTISSFAVFAAIGLFMDASGARADVKPHPLISNNMVLQQGAKARVWGTADDGERVVVRFRDEESTATTKDGRWSVEIDPQAAGGPFPLTVTGKNKLQIENVLVGEVWLCSGQSNMGWPVGARPNDPARAGTENPRIRLLTVPPQLANEPLTEPAGVQWLECGPKTIGEFSAVAYYFARELEKQRGVPVGLIHASYGGSGVQSWINPAISPDDPAAKAIAERQPGSRERNARAAERVSAEDIKKYEQAVAEAKRAGREPPRGPRLPTAPAAAGGLYNGMIAPVNSCSIRGVLWFQGEANTSDPDYYAVLFPGLIRSWRAAWRQGDFPFLFVQLAPFGEIVEQPQESDWARLREAQLLTSATVPNAFMAVITDWGHETDIHTKPKQPVGERLATLARAKVYGEKIVGEGPVLRSAVYSGGKALLTFANLGGGLEARKMAREDITTDRGSNKAGGALHVKPNTDGAPVPLGGFAIAGADGKFVNATAAIQGENVVVQSPQVAEPTQVRYGWADYPVGNLFNKAGLPATPFRTDGPPLNLDPPKSPAPAAPPRQTRPSR